MRLYALLPLALFAIATHAATIPDSGVEKKIEIISEDKNKHPDNISSDQELVDEPNKINDLDNRLRTKSAEIPVEIENVQAQISDDSEDIDRPAVDLRNTGPPQRQEHETQNPEFYAPEQEFVQAYKQNLKNAHVFLKQGFQGASDDITNLIGNNEQLKEFQDRVHNLRDGFISQINKLKESIQTILNADNNIEAIPGQQTKANLQTLETSLNTIKEDFTKGVNTLSNGLEILSSVRAEQVKQEAGTTTAAGSVPPAASGNPILTFFDGLNQNIQAGLTNLTQNWNNLINPGATTASSVPSSALADAPAGSAPGSMFGAGSIPFQLNIFEFFQNSLSQINGQVQQFFNSNRQTTQAPTTAATKPTEEIQKPVADSLGDRVTVPPATPVVTQPGPIAQFLQNNPISQSIAAAVQRLQNGNKPVNAVTPREPPQVTTEDQKKGHSHGSGDNNDSVDSGIKDAEPVKEVPADAPPKEEIKEQKREEVLVKTE